MLHSDWLISHCLCDQIVSSPVTSQCLVTRSSTVSETPGVGMQSLQLIFLVVPWLSLDPGVWSVVPNERSA